MSRYLQTNVPSGIAAVVYTAALTGSLGRSRVRTPATSRSVLVAGVLTRDIPTDPVRTAVYATAAQPLATIPDDPSSGDNVTSTKKHSAVRPGPRQKAAPAVDLILGKDIIFAGCHLLFA